MTQKVKNYIVAACLVIVLFILDQATKALAVAHLSPQKGGSDIILWEGVFRLRYLENRGAAFGMLQGRKAFLILVTVVVFVALCWFYTRIPVEKRFFPIRLIVVFILAGAVGNFVDRMRMGYVVDFFYFELINFPIFNVADIYVTCSAILFAVLFLFYYKEADLERVLPSRKRKA